MYENLAETLARIHEVDIDAVGLGDYGRHGGYFTRQMARWTRQWHLSKTRDLPAIDRLIDWLPRNLPEDDVTTLVHGDFRTGNVIFHPTEPRIVAVLDWELSTLGHPLADLAHCCVYVWMMNSGEFGAGLRDVDLGANSLPTMAEFVAAYARASGAPARLSTFHLAFALFRNAVIFEGIADRARRGNAAADNAEEVGRLAPKLAERGAELIDRGPDIAA
jgi:aminoglycoside phosphotransferase (APT) family kinase protein